MTWRHSSLRHSLTPSWAAEGGPAATGGSRDSGTVNGPRPDDRRSPGRGPLMPRPGDRPPDPALQRPRPPEPALQSLPSASRPRPGRSVSGQAVTTSGAGLSGDLIPFRHTGPSRPRFPRTVRRPGQNTLEKRTVRGKRRRPPRPVPPGALTPRPVPLEQLCPRRRWPPRATRAPTRARVPPTAADPWAGVSRGLPQRRHARLPPAPARGYGPPDGTAYALIAGINVGQIGIFSADLHLTNILNTLVERHALVAHVCGT